MRYFQYLFWGVVVILGVTFASLNAEPVHINYYFNQSVLSLPLLLFAALVVGSVLGMLIMLPGRWRTKILNRKQSRTIKQLEKQLASDNANG